MGIKYKQWAWLPTSLHPEQGSAENSKGLETTLTTQMLGSKKALSFNGWVTGELSLVLR